MNAVEVAKADGLRIQIIDTREYVDFLEKEVQALETDIGPRTSDGFQTNEPAVMKLQELIENRQTLDALLLRQNSVIGNAAEVRTTVDYLVANDPDYTIAASDPASALGTQGPIAEEVDHAALGARAKQAGVEDAELEDVFEREREEDIEERREDDGRIATELGHKATRFEELQAAIGEIEFGDDPDSPENQAKLEELNAEVDALSGDEDLQDYYAKMAEEDAVEDVPLERGQAPTGLLGPLSRLPSTRGVYDPSLALTPDEEQDDLSLKDRVEQAVQPQPGDEDLDFKSAVHHIEQPFSEIHDPDALVKEIDRRSRAAITSGVKGGGDQMVVDKGTSEALGKIVEEMINSDAFYEMGMTEGGRLQLEALADQIDFYARQEFDMNRIDEAEFDDRLREASDIGGFLDSTKMEYVKRSPGWGEVPAPVDEPTPYLPEPPPPAPIQPSETERGMFSDISFDDDVDDVVFKQADLSQIGTGGDLDFEFGPALDLIEEEDEEEEESDEALLFNSMLMP